MQRNVRLWNKCKAMIRLIITGIFIFLSFQLSAQVGLSLGYQSLNFNPEENGRSFDQRYDGPVVTIDYWFRLRNYRLEFKPGLSLGLLSSGAVDITKYQAVFSSRIYPFSFDDDCDCPTFSKRSGFFEDGFFLSLSPHFGYYDFSISLPDTAPDHSKDGFLFNMDLGAGIDIGFSDEFTLTPELRYRYVPKITGSIDFNDGIDSPVDGSMSGIFAGIGLTYRW